MTAMKSVLFFICAFAVAAAADLNANTSRSVDRSRLAREINCRQDLEYPHVNFCCLLCPAGHYVKQHCERGGEKGVCEPCEYGTYTEHSNGLDRCLPCTKCHSDQDAIEGCTSTKDTKCQCKAGTFCVADQACEVCKKCTKCKADEETVKNCSTTSNSVCRKKPPPDDIPPSMGPVVIAVVVVLFLLVVVLAIVFYCKRQKLKKTAESSSYPDEEVNINVDEGCERTVEERQNTQNAELEEPGRETQPFLPGNTSVGAKHPSSLEDEDRGLGDSLNNTANSSLTSLSAQPTASPSRSPHPSPKIQRQPIIREDGSYRRLIPVNGEESLMKAFDIIGKHLDYNYRNRFFRLIGLSDNAIHDRDGYPPDDRVYRLLKSWMEKEGLKADMNDLIQAFVQLDQKLSAEIVIEEVINHKYFRFQDESS